MRTIVAILYLLLLPAGLIAQPHSLEKLWASDTVLKTPESVLPDTKQQILYVSNIDGIPHEKDGKGFISRLGMDGRILDLEWVTGLNAPKGMGLYKGRLYVADITEVVGIDVKTARIVERIPVQGATFLNDISITPKGIIYVSDSRANKVYKIEKGNVFTLMDNLQGPNGLLHTADGLLVLDKGRILKVTPSGQLSSIADGMDPSTDGIEMVKNNEFIVSAWSGVIYYVYAGVQRITLLDTRKEKLNTADIGYDPVQRIVYIPTFSGNNVVAYRLK